MKKVLLFVLLCSFFESCKKSNSNDPLPTPNPISPSLNIYVAGQSSNGANGIATYWKNGSPVTLTDGTRQAEARSIAVIGNDIYVGGTEWGLNVNNISTGTATYWKNGSPVRLTDGTQHAYVYDMCASGNDVYTMGLIGSSIKYWKNNAMFSVTASTGASPFSIAVSNNDVFICGTVTTAGNHPHAVYWKGGVEYTLASSGDSEANDMFIVGTDVYVCGTDYSAQRAVYWKNGIEYFLSPPSTVADAESIFITGSDIYICGREDTGSGFRPRVWKNGIGTTLSVGSPGGGETHAIFVKNGDVYVAGNEGGFSTLAKAIYWKNGSPVALESGTNISYAYKIDF